MHRLVKPLIVLLAVPILTAVIAVSARQQWDDRWQAGLRREFAMRRQRVDERVVARYSLAALCSDGRTAATLRPCRTYNLFSSLVSASVVTGGLGLLMLGAIAAAGYACRVNRSRLPRVFPVGIYAVIAGLVVLVLLHAALAMAGLYLVGEIIERWPSFIVFGIGVAGLLAALAMIQLALSFRRQATASVLGRVLPPGTQPRLWAFIQAVARTAETAPPDRVVAGLGAAFFVTESKVLSLDGPLSGRILYLSLPLARILSVEELRGVLAHELAHFRAGDAGFSQRFYPLFAGVVRAIEGLGRQARGVRALVALPVLAVLSYFLDSFAAAEAAAEREREQAADQVAAAIAGREAYAAALVKIHAFAPAWDAVSAAMERAVSEGEQYVNASELFARVAAASGGPERLRGLGTRSLAHPTDRHPPLARRLEALSIAGAEVASEALATQPSVPAIALLDEFDAIEQSLTRVEHRLLAIGQEQAEMTGSPVDARS